MLKRVPIKLKTIRSLLKMQDWQRNAKRSCVSLEVLMVHKTLTVTLKMMIKQLLALVSLRLMKIMRMMLTKYKTLTKTSIRSLTQTTHKAKQSDNLQIQGLVQRMQSSQSEQSPSLSNSNRMTILTSLSFPMKSSQMTMDPQS